MRLRCEGPTLGLSDLRRVSGNLVWSSCGTLDSRGERNDMGEMPGPMSLYSPQIPRDVEWTWSKVSLLLANTEHSMLHRDTARVPINMQ
jgi:hypothetical protein